MAALVVLEELLDQHTTDGTQGRSTRNWKKEVIVLTYGKPRGNILSETCIDQIV
jgi:hypothetical protein